jgi:hypothetical protein
MIGPPIGNFRALGYLSTHTCHPLCRSHLFLNQFSTDPCYKQCINASIIGLCGARCCLRLIHHSGNLSIETSASTKDLRIKLLQEVWFDSRNTTLAPHVTMYCCPTSCMLSGFVLSSRISTSMAPVHAGTQSIHLQLLS